MDADQDGAQGAPEGQRESGRGRREQELWKVVEDRKAPHAAKVSALRELGSLDALAVGDVPHSLAEVQAMPTEQLHQEARRLELALGLPS